MLSSKTILITGASQGIGYLTAKALAQNGHHVYASMRDIKERNESAAKDLSAWSKMNNANLYPIELDVTNNQSIQIAIDKIESKHSLDVLINNAGIMPTGLTEAYTIEQAKDCFDVNLFGIMRTNRAVLPFMRERKSGLIINLSSTAGRLAIPFFGIYCASKWAMEAYCETMHYELEPFGIDSLLVEPSGHGTKLVETSPAPKDTKCIQSYGDVSKGREKLLNMFQTMFEQQDPSTDANNVAQKIIELVEEPNRRTLRTEVGQDMGVSAINQAVAPLQANLIGQLKNVYNTGHEVTI
ncbi:hypothetical protein NBRC116602_24940 [Hyphomicrobiales bacterium 4NK60-0047b]|jgi:NAD(P)-dependent dehydrogenase (short-subunit alcohol dehydrogenase family)